MSFFRIKCSNYFCVTPYQLSVISGKWGEGEKGRRERGEPNNQVAAIIGEVFGDQFTNIIKHRERFVFVIARLRWGINR
jgi:hypothetical protein